MTANETPDPTGADDRSTVVEVFGIKLSVRNRRLAEILSMDAAEALGFESKAPDRAQAHVISSEVVTEAVPYAALSVASEDDEAEARLRAQLRQRLEAIAGSLGFSVAQGGRWHSPSGLMLHTRIVSRPVSAAGAADMVGKLVALMDARPGGESVLLITLSGAVSDVFALAVRERGAHAVLRVASMDDLERLRAVSEGGAADHSAFLALLSPQAAVNAGAAISLLG
jgi:hypothetical protein